MRPKRDVGDPVPGQTCTRRTILRRESFCQDICCQLDLCVLFQCDSHGPERGRGGGESAVATGSGSISPAAAG
jgi:hypothetical protein